MDTSHPFTINYISNTLNTDDKGFIVIWNQTIMRYKLHSL